MGEHEVNNTAKQLAPQQAAPVKAETKHQIAFNAFRAGNKGNAPSQPLSAYDKTISYPWLHQMVEAIRGGNEKLKGQLPFRCAHYYAFEGNHRSQKGIIPESFLFQTTVDVDEKELVETALEMAKLLDTQEFVEQKAVDGSTIRMENPWKGQLLHLEYSARKKLHIDIRMPIGMTIEETQRSYCEALGVPCDESCFSPERIIFITDKMSEIFRSPHWYEVLPEEELKARREAFRQRGLSIDGRGISQNSLSTQSTLSSHSTQNLLNLQDSLNLQKVKSSEIHVNSQSTQNSQISPTVKNSDSPTSSETSSFAKSREIVKSSEKVKSDGIISQGVKSGEISKDGASCEKVKSVKSDEIISQGVGEQASDKNLIAFDLFRVQAGLKEVSIDTKGSRHSSLLAIMSAGASRVMSEEELRRVVALRMPSFAGERDCQQLIHDFYAKYCDGSKPFSKDVIHINAEAEKQSKLRALGRKNGGSFQEAGGSFQEVGESLQEVGESFQEVGESLQEVGESSNLQETSDEEDNPPEMPKKLPKLVELLVSKTPDIYKPAVACAIFPPPSHAPMAH